MTQDSKFKRWLEEKLERHDVFLEEPEALDRLIKIVDSWVLEAAGGPVHFHLKETLMFILMRIPEDVLDYLVNGRVFSFVIPSRGVVAITALEAQQYLCVDPSWFATLTSSDKVYVLAHELAHVYLNHPRGYPLEKKELEADQLVVKWGFKEELRACPYNYLYGTGLDRLRWKDD
jgi:hypothetical protein